MATSAVTVRDARPEDLGHIVDFNLRLARETESRVLDLAVLTRGVSLALADPDRLHYWMAERDGHVVGQTAVTREWSDWRAGWIWWLQSVYVVESARGQGVFRALYGHVREAARADTDSIGLRLYVEHENERAQKTYQAMGMKPGGYHVFEELWPERFVNPAG
jgi:GNAT superfamily N-acetyltransferase